MEVAPFVMLRDPSRNKFEVKIEKKNGKVYFTDGWATMKDIYIITACSWMTVIYANHNLFLFHGVTRKEREFLYPRFSPPKRFLLKYMSPSSAGNTTIPNAPAFLFLPKKFYHTIQKHLTASNVDSRNLVRCVVNKFVYFLLMQLFSLS